MFTKLFRRKDFDRPIFLVGSSKSGTTLLGSLFQVHPDVGPKLDSMSNDNVQDFIESILKDGKFDQVANELEEKELWDHYFPFPKGVILRQGKELALFKNPLSRRETRNLKVDLSRYFHEKRFFSKQPFNTFRIAILREIFPDAIFIAIHRDGRDVISSWGRKGDRWRRHGGYVSAIKLMAEKWNEAIDFIEEYKDKYGIYTLKYEDLVSNPETELKNAFEHCQLNYIPSLYDGLQLRNESNLWRKRIPQEFHDIIEEETKVNLDRLNYLK